MLRRSEPKPSREMPPPRTASASGYDTGEGVPQDYAEAVKWYRLAAEQGYAAAQFNLGVGYANGEGVPQDYAEAVKWYRLAAEQGYAAAQYNLGVMHDKRPRRPAKLRRSREVVSARRRAGTRLSPVQPRP